MTRDSNTKRAPNWLGPALILISIPALFSKPAADVPQWIGLTGCALFASVGLCFVFFNLGNDALAKCFSLLSLSFFLLIINCVSIRSGPQPSPGILGPNNGKRLFALAAVFADVAAAMLVWRNFICRSHG
jgi:hypothetical protein